MEISKDGEENKIKLPSFIHTFAVLIILLLSISFLNFTIRAIFGSDYEAENKIINQIYDYDLTSNLSLLCPLTKRPDKSFKLEWNNTMCYNKTLLQWHIPWVKEWLWKKFNEITAERKRLKEIKEIELKKLEEAKEPNIENEHLNIEEPTEEIKKLNSSEESEKQSASSIVYTILTAMTLMMAILACLELFREKFNKKPIEDQKDSGRRCSLADFTINRHLRKESMQENLQRQAAFDDHKKVKELLHQGSLDRAFSRLTPKVRLPRQSSMPARCSSMGPPDVSTSSNLQLIRNQSVDLPDDDGSPGMRRKSRHFIRRH